MADFTIDQDKLPGVKEVVRDFAVLEDHCLAHNLQEQEIESHLASNVHKSRLVQKDLQVAKRLQEEEDLRAKAQKHRQHKAIERSDNEMAQEIQEQLVWQAEQQRQQEEKDELIARKLYEKEKKEERRRQKQVEANFEEEYYEDKSACRPLSDSESPVSEHQASAGSGCSSRSPDNRSHESSRKGPPESHHATRKRNPECDPAEPGRSRHPEQHTAESNRGKEGRSRYPEQHPVDGRARYQYPEQHVESRPRRHDREPADPRRGQGHQRQEDAEPVVRRKERPARPPPPDQAWERERDRERRRDPAGEGERDRERRRARDQERERERDGPRNRERPRERDRSRDRHGSNDADRDREGYRSRDGERDRHGSKGTDRDTDRDQDRHGSRDGERARQRSRDRHGDRDQVRQKSRDRQKSRERDRDRSRDRQKSRERDRDRSRDRGLEEPQVPSSGGGWSGEEGVELEDPRARQRLLLGPNEVFEEPSSKSHERGGRRDPQDLSVEAQRGEAPSPCHSPRERGRIVRGEYGVREVTQGITRMDLQEQEVQDMEVARRLQEEELKASQMGKRAAQVAQDEEIARLLMEEEKKGFKKSREKEKQAMEKRRPDGDWKPAPEEVVRPRSRDELEYQRPRNNKPARPPPRTHDYENVTSSYAYSETPYSPRPASRPEAAYKGSYYRQ